jgi:hypothetical protein
MRSVKTCVEKLYKHEAEYCDLDLGNYYHLQQRSSGSYRFWGCLIFWIAANMDGHPLLPMGLTWWADSEMWDIEIALHHQRFFTSPAMSTTMLMPVRL